MDNFDVGQHLFMEARMQEFKRNHVNMENKRENCNLHLNRSYCAYKFCHTQCILNREPGLKDLALCLVYMKFFKQQDLHKCRYAYGNRDCPQAGLIPA